MVVLLSRGAVPQVHSFCDSWSFVYFYINSKVKTMMCEQGLGEHRLEERALGLIPTQTASESRPEVGPPRRAEPASARAWAGTGRAWGGGGRVAQATHVMHSVLSQKTSLPHGENVRS